MDGRNWEILRASNDKRVDRLLLLSIIFVLKGIVDFVISKCSRTGAALLPFPKTSRKMSDSLPDK